MHFPYIKIVIVKNKILKSETNYYCIRKRLAIDEVTF